MNYQRQKTCIKLFQWPFYWLFNILLYGNFWVVSQIGDPEDLEIWQRDCFDQNWMHFRPDCSQVISSHSACLRKSSVGQSGESKLLCSNAGAWHQQLISRFNLSDINYYFFKFPCKEEAWWKRKFWRSRFQITATSCQSFRENRSSILELQLQH